jgi:tetratricopeptide (TPR) repeat protein
MVIALALLTSGVRAEPAGWSWVLPVERYQKLNLSQRASVDRARELQLRGEDLRKRGVEKDAIASFRSAAAEWKRFTVEFMDAPESAMAYAQFMQAFSTQAAKDRNSAVKLYTEVLDFYPDTPSVAVPARYWRGQAYADNGDQAAAVADWQAVAEDETAAGHPLAALALERLASDEWARGKWTDAARRWEAICSGYHGVARGTAEDAMRNLMLWRGFQGQWTDLTPLVEQARGDARGRADLAWHFAHNAWNWSRNEWRRDYLEKAFKGAEVDKRLEQFRRGLVEWFAGLAPLFEGVGRGWDLELAVFGFRRELDAKQGPALAASLAGRLRASTVAAAEKERRARGLMDCLAQAAMPVEARTLLDLVTDPVQRLWAAYSIAERTADYKAALSELAQLEQQADPEGVRRAKRTRAYLYKDRTNECEKAIPLFMEVADPPATLWALQECFRRTGKKAEAQQTLTEIASVFPPEAARAMFQKAEYFERDGQKSEAIAHYRRLMAHPEWKASPESSRAHQALERLGIATGGAVLHDVN